MLYLFGPPNILLEDCLYIHIASSTLSHRTTKKKHGVGTADESEAKLSAAVYRLGLASG
jgi:hypothetical protein